MSDSGRKNSRVNRFEGTPLSPGVAIGTAYRIEKQHPTFYRIRISPRDVNRELERLRSAIETSRQQYLRDKEKYEAAVGREHSYIIDAHLLMLEDADFIDQIERRIRDDFDSPEKALRHVGDQLLAVYDSLEDPYFRERGSDFDEVIERVIGNLMAGGATRDFTPKEDVVLVGSQIGLSILARFPLERVKGLVLTKAGETSHVAIIARSFQIPVVSGIENLRDLIETGDSISVDGSRGIVQVGITRDEAEEILGEIRAHKRRATEEFDHGPCVTRDGVRVNIFGNTEFGTEVSQALELGAEGIGLFRSEYIYMKQSRFGLSEEELYQVYRQLAEEIGDRPASIRTLDIARQYREGVQAGEEGAVLGLRGIRLSLKEPEVFRTQIRAIVRARRFGNLRIMLPMVTSVDELLDGRKLIRKVENELGENLGIPVGVLVEVPAAVYAIQSIAEVADFLAVGTNDLIQYTLAAGRLNEEIGYLYNPLHPAILQSLNRIVRTCASLNRQVVVCGEMASHPLYASILVGLGFRYLSMSSVAIPELKKIIRSSSAAELREQAQRLLELRSLAEIDRYLSGVSSVADYGRKSGLIWTS